MDLERTIPEALPLRESLLPLRVSLDLLLINEEPPPPPAPPPPPPPPPCLLALFPDACFCYTNFKR